MISERRREKQRRKRKILNRYLRGRPAIKPEWDKTGRVREFVDSGDLYGLDRHGCYRLYQKGRDR